MENIDEIIADAIAEEEVKKEQEKTNKEKAERESFRETLREQLKDAIFTPRESEKVTVSLKEYTTLKIKEMDLGRILSSILSDVRLNYSKDGLTIDDGDVVDVIKALYPDVYDAILDDLLEDEGE